MLIYTKNNNDDEIHFKPKTITDGMKIGIIMEKLKSKGVPIKLDVEDGDITKLSIKQKDLIDLLC